MKAVYFHFPAWRAATKVLAQEQVMEIIQLYGLVHGGLAGAVLPIDEHALAAKVDREGLIKDFEVSYFYIVHGRGKG